MPEVFDRTDLAPRERLLAAFDIHSPLCPFIVAAVEIHDPGHPAREYARKYKNAFAARLTDTAREAGATNPEELGEQLALLLDGASARSRVLNAETLATAAAIATALVDKALPPAAAPAGAGTVEQHGRDHDGDDAVRGGTPPCGQGAVAERPGEGHILDRIPEQRGSERRDGSVDSHRR